MTFDDQVHPISIMNQFEFDAPVGQPARPAGRPKTRTPEYFAGLLRDHAAMADWFLVANGRAAKSDVELLNAFLANELQRLGMRPNRLQSNKVQARIKTIRNHLSQARKDCSRVPEIPVYSGWQKVDIQTAYTCNE